MAAPLAITAGASRVEQLAVSFGSVASARFPAGLEIPRHHQSDPSIAVVLAGGWAAGGRSHELDAYAPSVLVEPAGDIHAKVFGAVETAVVSLTLEAGRLGAVVGELTQAYLAKTGQARHLERPLRHFSVSLFDVDGQVGMGVDELDSRHGARDLDRLVDVELRLYGVVC